MTNNITNKTLLNAILAMDSYNRGYGEKVKDLPSTKGTKIGNAVIQKQSEINPTSSEVNASFYAISYTHNNETIISYRGTDNALDTATGWTTGSGAHKSDQAYLAADFYKSVIGNTSPYNANVEFVGHSLGGGLAGLMAKLYNKEATIFDNMPFEKSATGAYVGATAIDNRTGLLIDQELRDRYYFNGATPQPHDLNPDYSKIKAYATTGEILSLIRPAQSAPVDYLDSNGGLRSQFDLHSQALLVTLLYSQQQKELNNVTEDWIAFGKELMDSLFNNDIAKSLNIMENENPPVEGSADKMLNKIAYSALHATAESGTNGEIANDELVFGDTSIQALFNDANEFGKILQLDNLPKIFKVTPLHGTPYSEWNIREGVAKMLVQFAAKLAEGKTFYSNHSEAINGMLNFNSSSNILTLDVSKDSNSLWDDTSPIEKQAMLNNLYIKFGISNFSHLPNADDVDHIIIATTDNGVTNDSFTEDSNDTSVIFGGYGNDTLRGSDGQDVLIGGFGNDNLSGGIGNDILDGGANDGNVLLNQNNGSSDTLSGSFGSDTYIFSGSFGNDTIIDDGLGVNVNGAIIKDKIIINNQTIFGIANYIEGGTSWKLGSYIITKSGSSLQIVSSSANASGAININNFTNGDFGITLQEKPEEPGIDDDVSPQIGIGENANAARRSDPLTLDLNHNGRIDLISLNQSDAKFDLQGDGLKRKVGWVGGNDSNNDGIIDDIANDGSRLNDADGFLVLDSNNNGVVDNINELFGHKNADGTTTTGTDELSLYDLNQDGKINSNDSVFNQLKIWQDFNGNGTTEAGELSNLSDHNIANINLETSISNQNINGNVILSSGTFEFNDPNNINPITNLPRTITSVIANLDLAFDPTNSEGYGYQDAEGNNVGNNINPQALLLPLSRGYGNAKAWHIAMSEDEALLQMMQDMVNLDNSVTIENINSKIEEFIYRWTGAEDESGMRGSFDAKKLAALEAYRGSQYTDITGSHNPVPQAVNFLQNAWNNLVKKVTDRILIQGTFKEIFTDHNSDNIAQVSYNFATDKLDFSTISGVVVIENIKEHYESLDVIEGAYYLKALAPIINSAAEKFGYYQFIDDLTNAVGEIPTQIIFGTDNSDEINANSWGNAVIKGQKGDDVINANNSNDDVYVYSQGDGHDIINDNWGNDKIVFDASITKQDVYFTLQNQYDLVINFTSSPSDSIVIKNHFNYHAVETLKFGDGGTIDLLNLPAFEINGTDGDDLINAGRGDDIINAGAGNDVINDLGGNDVINGGNGDDFINANNGNDVVNGGDGNDRINGGYENDVINAGRGDDVINGQEGNDVYIYNKNDGKDVISESGINYYNQELGIDKIKFGADISASDIYFSQIGSDLIINFKNSPDDQIKIVNQVNFSNQRSIETLEFDNGDAAIAINNLNNLNFEYQGTSGDDSVASYYGNNIVDTGAGNDQISVGGKNNTINAGDGNDTISVGGENNIINAGKGDDIINGGYSKDTYLYSKGDGKDVISDNGYYAENNFHNDEIIFDASINKTDVVITQNGFDIIISFADLASDQITIKNHFLSTEQRIETLKFANGDEVDLTTLLPSYNGTDGDDVINAGGTDDVISTGAGNDNINDVGGNNAINAGVGNDIITSGYGNDAIDGADGDDVINAGSGDDVINGGEGNDIINGEEGNDIINAGRGDDIIGYSNYYHSGDNSGDDIYIYNQGDGKDTINENPSGYGFYRTLGNDKIKFGADILASDIYFSQNGSDIIIHFRNSPDDQIRIVNQVNSGDGRGIETLEFDNGDAAINITNLNNLNFEYQGTAGDDSITSYYGSNIVNTGAGNDEIFVGGKNNIVNAGDGNDTISVGGENNIINAGKGDDIINGGYSKDTYLYSKGDGKDVISDNGYYAENNFHNDEIIFDASINKTDVVITQNGFDIIISFADLASDQITIKNHFLSTEQKIETLKFANGDEIDLAALVPIYNGTDGDDVINSSSGNDTINAGAGNDIINSGNGDDIINGEDGNDTIYSGYGNDIINGGKGDDLLTYSNYYSPNYGDDTYLYKKGDGADTIAEASNYQSFSNVGNDVVKFGSDILANNIYFSRNNNDLIIKFRNSPTDSITIQNQFLSTNHKIETLKFDNGDADIDIRNPLSLTFEYHGTDGNDNINGSDGVDIMFGGKGDDTISGEYGDDQYFYSKNDGKDILINSGGQDSIIFDATIGKDEISFLKDGYDLIINFNNSPLDQIKIQNHFSNESVGYIKTLKFSDNTIVDLLNIPEMTLTYEGTSGSDEILNFYAGNKIINGGDGNDNIITSAGGDDVIKGGKGDDYILNYDKNYYYLNNASSGNDTYLYSQGDGSDTIFDNGGNDAIVFDSTINKENVVIKSGNANTNQQYDLVITFADSAQDKITVQNFFSPDYQGKIESLKFANGEIIDLTSPVFNYQGTAGNDVINSSNGNDIINAGSGNDTISAFAGDDIINAGLGNDKINGGLGNDIYIYNSGDGSDIIGETNNYYFSYNELRLGNDTIKFGEGITKDDIYFSLDNSGVGLKINFRNSLSDSITIQNQFEYYSNNAANSAIENLQFVNGDVINISSLSNLTFEFNGTGGNDAIYAGNGNDLINSLGGNDIIEAQAGNDIINAGRGNDVIGQGSGNAGDDIYIYNKGDGNDTIYEVYQYGYSVDNGNDIIKFGLDISKDDIYFSRDGNDLTIKFHNSLSDSITIKNQFQYEGNRVETLQFDNGDDSISLNNELVFIYNGTDGNDFIYSSDGNDLINSGGGDDQIYAAAGDDIINSGAGNDAINAGEGNDNINAGAGDDNINPGSGDDIINAGKGDDIIGQGNGNYGDDTYIYQAGDGKDTIIEYPIVNNNNSYGNDVISFGDAINKTDIFFSKNNDDLIIRFRNSAEDQITIQNQFQSQSNHIETLKFSDGSSIDISNPLLIDIEYIGTDNDDYIYADANANNLNGFAGSDTIFGNEGDDIINGGADDDTIYGGEGSDTYIYNLGDGNDLINDTSYADNSDFDSIIINGVNSPDDILLSRNGNSGLVVKIISTGETITIQNQFYGSDNRIESLRLVNNGALVGNIDLTTLGNMPIVGTDGDDYLGGSDEDDTIIGGTGNDYMSSGAGNDNYVYNVGDGNDVIYEYGASEADFITINGVSAISDLELSRNSSGLLIKIIATGQTITINSHFDDSIYQIESVRLVNNGVVIGNIDLTTLGNMPIVGTSNDDYIFGSDGDDTMIGGAGDDYMYGGEGNDNYVYNVGDGNDFIYEYSASKADFITINGVSAISDLELSRNSSGLLIKIIATGQIITISNHFSNSMNQIESVRLVNNGVVIGNIDLTALGNMPIVGTSNDDYIFGSDGDDTMIGGAGNDYIYGSGGSDIFVIEPNNFNNTTIIADLEFSNHNEKIDLSKLTNIHNFNDLIIIPEPGFITINLPEGQKIILNNVELENISADNFIFARINNAPTIFTSIQNQSTITGANFIFTIPDTTFTDIDNDILAYNLKIQNPNGTISDLPSWLNFNPTTKTLSGTAPNSSVGTIELLVIANDGSLEANQTFNLNIQTNQSHDIQNTITGTNSKDTLIGTNLNDQISGGANADILYGGLGNDTLLGGSSDDILIGGEGSDILDGGTAIDTASYNDSNTAVNINLLENTAQGGTAQGDTFINIENITGSNFNDNLTGNNLNNVIDGGSGNDIINGGAGNDKIIGGAGADIIDGGDGIDTVHYTSSNGAVNINLSTNVNQGGTAQGDILINIENITGSDFSDNLTGDNNNNLIYGGAGNDNIFGQDGNDTLYGGANNDIINGDNGNDKLIGDTGNDILIGGAGVDNLTGGA
ncbi:MAG: calcium-binding protein, partial [Pseudomonadota bacterium]